MVTILDRPVEWKEKTRQRLIAHSRSVGDCIEWIGSRSRTGYGRIGIAHQTPALAHRVAYELNVGPIPEGLTVDHLCRNRACINTSHMEIVSLKENILRGEGASVRNAKKTHCPSGHPYTGENLRVDKDGWRKCVICVNGRVRRQNAQRKLTLSRNGTTQSPFGT